MPARAILTTILLGLALLPACNHRAIGAVDGVLPPPADGARPRGDGRDDQPSRLADAPLPTLCNQLAPVGQVALGLTAGSLTQAMYPALAFDGQGKFGAVWVSQKISPASDATLTFATVGLDGKSSAPLGTILGLVKADVEPALVHYGAEYAALYAAPDGETTLSRFGDQAVVVSWQTGIGNATAFALASHPLAYAVLYVNPLITELRFAQFPASSPILDTLVHTGEPYWNLWLAPRAGGFSAAWGKRFARLDGNGGLVGPPATVIATDALAAAHLALPDGGHVIAYARSSDFVVELQRLDATGKPLGGPHTVAPANIGAAPFKQLGLVWTGSRFLVTYAAASPGAQVMAQLLDATGALVGQPTPLARCLISSAATGAAAFGGGRVAVATIDGLSGLPSTAVCPATITSPH